MYMIVFCKTDKQLPLKYLYKTCIGIGLKNAVESRLKVFRLCAEEVKELQQLSAC